MHPKFLLLFALACLLTASVKAQPLLTISKKDVPLETVFKIITDQTGYTFFYNVQVLQQAKPVTIQVKDAPLAQVLDHCFKRQPLTYQVINTTIVVKEKAPVSQDAAAPPPIDVRGQLVSSTGAALEGVSITVRETGLGTTSNTSGQFELTNVDPAATLIISGITILTREVPVSNRSLIQIEVSSKVNQMADVAVAVNTGYQSIPKERATGSFVHISNELFNRKVGTNVLDRLDGITSGLLFNKTNNADELFSIRGRSTLLSSASATPLIVLDNFPYEGNLNNINPNDIESITVLKDAAAASIWGARSANGVVVITTKKGKQQSKISVTANANITIQAKPDLFYSGNYLSSPGFIGVESLLFDKGYYNTAINNRTSFPALTPVVEILEQKRRGVITASDAAELLAQLSPNDVRHDYNKHIYQRIINRQYALSFTGGSPVHSYVFSVGFDNNQENLVRNGSNRLSLKMANTYKPLKKLVISAGLTYTYTIDKNHNQYSFSNPVANYALGSPIYPYASLASADNTPLPVVKDIRTSYADSMHAVGFLDWKHYPLHEIDIADITTATRHLLLNTSARYDITRGLHLAAYFQHENQQRLDRNLHAAESYYVRERVNKYAQRNTATGAFTYQLPKGAILDLSNVSVKANNVRLQAGYNRSINSNHDINAIVGAELRERTLEAYSRISYGYNDQYGTAVSNINYATALPVNPSGTATIPAPSGSVGGSLQRFVSYYANAAYTWSSRYTVSASARKDGANIFGVRTNDKLIPLWSAGLAWHIHNEPFFKLPQLQALRLRATYGFNGNTYDGNAFLTARYSTMFSLSGMPYGTITNPPNPELRWEKVKNINIGLDFSLKKLLSGSVDWYTRRGLDLIEDAPLPPSSGFSSFKGNAASTVTNGVDIVLNGHLQISKLNWEPTVLINYNKDRLTRFNTRFLASNLASGTGGLVAVEGKPLFGIYSFPWQGLDAATGDPLGLLDQKPSNNYVSILAQTAPEDLAFHGSARPSWFGAFRNQFSYRNFSLSFNITYKLGYYFRKRTVSLNYSELLSSGRHADYFARWQQPGDEAITQVPSLVYPSNTNRNNFYQYASVLVHRADHIRWQDIQLSYRLTRSAVPKLPFASVEFYTYAQNLGIIWKHNKVGIDPDYNDRFFSYPQPLSLSFGVRLNP